MFFGQGKSNSSPDKDGENTTHEMKYIFSPANITISEGEGGIPHQQDITSTLHSPPSLKPVI